MAKKIAGALLAVGLLTVGIVFVLYVSNTAPPVPPISAADATNPARPFVVKLHARWCPVCMMTQSIWSQIENTYAGRVNLLVFDFTNDATTAASRAEAKRLGLEAFFDETGGTGIVIVLDGRTRTITASIAGSRDFAAYRSAIDSALNARE